MKSKPIVVVAVALLIGCVAFPVTLHQLTLSRIRELTFAATRFAAATPEALRSLPVTHWEEGSAKAQPTLSQIGWEQYRMTIPQTDKSLVVDLDLRSTILPLLLGFGGWLRMGLMVLLGSISAYVILLRGVTPDGDPIFASSRAPWLNLPDDSTRAMPTNGVFRWQDPSQQESMLTCTLNQLPYTAFFFDTHHQLIHWNDAAQLAIPHLTLSSGIHMLDLSAHLPWGSEMVEKMDEIAQQSAVIIHKGESLCVIPG